MRTGSKHLGFLLLVVLLVGCGLPEPQIILQTRLVEREVTREVVLYKEVTRLVRQVITATPLCPTSTSQPTIRVCFSTDLLMQSKREALQRFVEALEQRTGFRCSVIEVAGAEQAVAALCSGQADVCWMSVGAYLMAHAHCAAEARLTVVREGSSTRIAQLMVQADQVRQARGLAPIRALQDLSGKSVAFTDPQSATGYFFPKAALREAGVEPAQEVFVGGDAQAALVVYTGEADAAASSWAPPQADGSPGDARANLVKAYPDAPQVVQLLWLSKPIPHEPVVFRRGLPEDVQDKLIASLIALAKSEEGSRLLFELCRMEGFSPASDRDYDVVRAMADALGLEYSQLLRMR